MTTTSFFGGRPGVSHYTLALPYDYSLRGEARKEANAKRSEDYKTLKAAGYKERYFQFHDGNEKEELSAKARAETERSLWLKATGLDLIILKGCFL